jgi:hypothetical protein
MDWQRQLSEISEKQSLVPTFDQWLDATGYREYERCISAGNVNMQAMAMRSLYDYYESEMRKRFRFFKGT